MTFKLNKLFTKIYCFKNNNIPPIPKLIPEMRELFEKYKYTHTINELLNEDIQKLDLSEEENNQHLFNYVDKKNDMNLINVIYCVCINNYILYHSNLPEYRYQIVNDLESIVLKFHLIKVKVNELKDFEYLHKYKELLNLFTLIPSDSNYEEFKTTVNEIYKDINKYLIIKPEYIYLQKLCIYVVNILMKEYLNLDSFNDYISMLNNKIHYVVNLINDVDNLFMDYYKTYILNPSNNYSKLELEVMNSNLNKIDGDLKTELLKIGNLRKNTIKINLIIIKWISQKILNYFNEINIYCNDNNLNQFYKINIYDLKINEFIGILYHLYYFIKYDNDLLFYEKDYENEYDKNNRIVNIKYNKIPIFNEVDVLNEIINDLDLIMIEKSKKSEKSENLNESENENENSEKYEDIIIDEYIINEIFNESSKNENENESSKNENIENETSKNNMNIENENLNESSENNINIENIENIENETSENNINIEKSKDETNINIENENIENETSENNINIEKSKDETSENDNLNETSKNNMNIENENLNETSKNNINIENIENETSKNNMNIENSKNETSENDNLNETSKNNMNIENENYLNQLVSIKFENIKTNSQNCKPSQLRQAITYIYSEELKK